MGEGQFAKEKKGIPLPKQLGVPANGHQTATTSAVTSDQRYPLSFP